MKEFPLLKPGDSVEIIAPASRCADVDLASLKNLLKSWQLNCIVTDDIFGQDLLCANTDEARFKHLQNALQNPLTKAIICARGGYGSMRLIPHLAKLIAPESFKIFIGMSDITTLHLFLQQQWQWSTIHGALMPDRFSPESIQSLKEFLFGEVKQIEFTDLFPLNKAAEKNHTIESSITGGNLCLIQAGMGTIWQMDARGKIILLEEIGERGYRVDRMLEHLSQANVFEGAAAILLGDFLEGKEPDGTSLIEPVLNRFANHCEIPVVRVKGVGHGYINFPIPLCTQTTLQLGKKIKLRCGR